MCWFIWKGRNEVVSRGESPQIDGIILRCKRAIQEYSDAQKSFGKYYGGLKKEEK